MEQLDSYVRLFTDAGFWAPYVREVCGRHGLGCAAIRTGVPGTCPVFIVDETWVVKFFGRLFDGAKSAAAEREAGRLAGLDGAIRTAKLAAWGELGTGVTCPGEWPWPYLIFEYVRGVSIGEVMDRLTREDRLQAARDLGETVRRLHALPLEGSPVFPNDHGAYLRFLEGQRAGLAGRLREWGSLPKRLIDQVEDFMPPLEALVDRSRPPHLIHADLTRDHLLGRFENGRWASLALIDFGDARTGSLLYELAALHLDLFNAEKPLLAAFLDTYGLDAEARAGLPRKALATALLHQFDVFQPLRAELANAGSLEELAEQLWRV